MNTGTLTTLPTPFAGRRGARARLLGALVALGAWALLWGYFVAGIAAPAGRLAAAFPPVTAAGHASRAGSAYARVACAP